VSCLRASPIELPLSPAVRFQTDLHVGREGGHVPAPYPSAGRPELRWPRGHDLEEPSCQEDAQEEQPHCHALAPERQLRQVLGESVTVGRKVLQAELQARSFDLRPSNTRLVQCFMSKQVPASTYLSSSQLALAKTLYTQMLRTALEISKTIPTRSSPPRAAKKPRVAPGGMLFRGSSGLAADESSPAMQGAPEVDEYDPVVDEMCRASRSSP